MRRFRKYRSYTGPVQPYFVLNGNLCALLATKDHGNIFIYDPTVRIVRRGG